MKECKDHLGATYKSINEMTKAYGVLGNTYKYRINKGLSVEKALTMKSRRGRNIQDCEITDHLGNKFGSKAEAAKAHGVCYRSFNRRLDRGLPIEKALNGRKIKDHLGNEYNSTSEMLRYWKVPMGTYKYRLSLGLPLKVVLTQKERKIINKKVKDHLGNEYTSIKSMANAYGISEQTYRNRISKGLSVEESLKREHLSGRKLKPKIKDHLGKEHYSQKEMAEYWGISYNTYRVRIKIGMNIEEALTSQTQKGRKISSGKVTDHLGNVYRSEREMAENYGLSTYTYHKRIKNGATIEQALTYELYARLKN